MTKNCSRRTSSRPPPHPGGAPPTWRRQTDEPRGGEPTAGAANSLTRHTKRPRGPRRNTISPSTTSRGFARRRATAAHPRMRPARRRLARQAAAGIVVQLVAQQLCSSGRRRSHRERRPAGHQHRPQLERPTGNTNSSPPRARRRSLIREGRDTHAGDQPRPRRPWPREAWRRRARSHSSICGNAAAKLPLGLCTRFRHRRRGPSHWSPRYSFRA
jgi:hypothetical protein